jgi:hypothetical protein
MKVCGSSSQTVWPPTRGAGDQPVVTALGHQGHLEFTGNGIDPPKTGVVAGVFVFVARVAQAD